MAEAHGGETMQKQEIQQCRDSCARTADMLRSVPQGLTSQRAKEALSGAAYHLEMCIHSCDEAIKDTGM